jgi:hypothetical protein
MSQIYSKDSLDRFGDDLCEYVLSFLSIEDRFRFECLSKQWQRVVYQTQTQLIINSKICDNQYVNNTTFERIIKKCPNITYITINNHLYDYIYISNKIFDHINKYCRNFNEFDYIFYNNDQQHNYIQKLCQTIGNNSFELFVIKK